MKLGCRNSSPLQQLIGSGGAEIEFIQIAGPVDAMSATPPALYPALLHPDFGIGDSAESYKGFDWESFNCAVKKVGSPHIAMHLEVSTKNWNRRTGLKQQDRAEVRAMHGHLTALLKLLQERLAVPVLLENMDYMGTELKPGYGVYRASVEPDFMRHLVEQEKAGMLLDLAHLRVTAHHLDMDIFAFARHLPLDAVREIHVSGPRFIPAVGLRDEHEEMQNEDYALLLWMLDHCRPEFVTLEYPKSHSTSQSFTEQTHSLERQLAQLSHIIS